MDRCVAHRSALLDLIGATRFATSITQLLRWGAIAIAPKGPFLPTHLEDISAMAGVSVPAVSQWRTKRGSDFPAPLPGYETLAFNKGEVEAWLKRKNKSFKPLNLEATLWAAADKMRGHMDAAEYKHVVLGLVFLKYISDAFEARHRELLELKGSEGADPEDPDEYRAEHVFWVPPDARWEKLQGAAKQPEIGALIDAAMEAIERENSSLKGVLPKDYVVNDAGIPV